MALVVLFQAQPRLPSTGQLTSVRLAGGGSAGAPYLQLGIGDWRAGGASKPRFTAAIGFAQDGFTGGALPQTGGFRFFPSDKDILSSLGNLFWDGARVTINMGDDEDPAPAYPLAFVGSVASAKVASGIVSFTLADLSLDLDKPAAPNTFAGTGGAEGGDDATGRVKRRSWGYVFNVEGLLLDKANSIYEFGDPARKLTSFPMVKDKGVEASSYVDVPWQGTVADTLTMLRATQAPQGGCARAPSIGCVKWWTTPAGPLTADIVGEGGAAAMTPANLASLIVGEFSAQITVGNAGEANGWIAATCGVHVDQTGETVGNLLDRLLIPVSIAWLLGGDGVLSFRRLAWSNAVEALNADTIEREEVFAPIRTRRVGFQRNYRVHSDGEISAVLIANNNGTYADGTPIEVLKPAEAGATAGARLGNNLYDSGGVVQMDSAVKNGAVSIAANGALSGAGGGQVTLSGVGYSGDTDAQRNTRIVVDNFGRLIGIGVGDQTYVNNLSIIISGTVIYGIGLGNATYVANNGISIGANGALAGGGGGQVTLSGVGYSGDTDAQRNTRIFIDGFGTLQGVGLGNGAYVNNWSITISGTALNGIGSGTGAAVVNNGVSIGANGALAGAGGGQVSLGGLGAGGLATKDQAGAADIAPSAVQVVTYAVLTDYIDCPVGN